MPYSNGTAQELIESARLRLQDFTDQSYTDADMLQYAIDAEADFALTGCNQTVVEKQLTNQDSLSFSTIDDANTVLAIMRVDIDYYPLSQGRIDEDGVWPSTSSGTPTGWMEWGNKVYLNKQRTGLVNFWYIYAPQMLTSLTDSILTPRQWWHALVAYICHRCLMSSEDAQHAAQLAEYNTLRQQAMVLYQVRYDTTKTQVEAP
jgi:hypothetical protein